MLCGLIILYGINLISGSAYTKALWKMIYNQITTEEQTIQDELLKEIDRLAKEEEKLIQEKNQIKKQLTTVQVERDRLTEKLHEIEDRLNAVGSNLPPASDLNAIAERFKSRGYNPVVLSGE